MSFNLTRRAKLIVVFTVVVALLGGVGYGGYRYWQSQNPAQEEQVEVVEHPDGSRTFYNYRYNYKISVPKGWEMSPVGVGRVDYKIVELRKENRDGFFGYINIHSWAKPIGEGTPSYLRSVRRTDSEDIPKASNSQFAGVAVYTYRSDARPDSMDLAVTAFENGNVIYVIYTPWEHKDINEYQSILQTFAFLK